MKQNLLALAQGSSVTDKHSTYYYFLSKSYSGASLIFSQGLGAHAGKELPEKSISESLVMQAFSWPALDPWSIPKLQLTLMAHTESSI